MIEYLNIIKIEPPNLINFPQKRRVLVEKFIYKEYPLKKVLENYRNSIVAPGEYIWVIDANSLVIERYIISLVPEILENGSKIFFFDKKGKFREIHTMMHVFLDTNNTLNTFHLYGGHSSGDKLICSSEEDVLISLKKYIPLLIKKIQENLFRGNMSIEKQAGKKTRIKELQKFQKFLAKS